MLRFFRQIRQRLLAENRLRSYTGYAIGEIILVVAGILIALQINNWNETRKTHQKETVYLQNIRKDLELNLASLDEFIGSREETAASAEELLEYFEDRKPLDPDDFNFRNVTVLVWYPFIQHANTYEELLNSGNLSILSNGKIRNGLQDMQTAYHRIAFIENEMQQDYERYLYEAYFSIIDLKTSMAGYDEFITDPENISSRIDADEARALMRDKMYKNGLVLSAYNSTLLIEAYSEMVDRTQALIDLIVAEIGSG